MYCTNVEKSQSFATSAVTPDSGTKADDAEVSIVVKVSDRVTPIGIYSISPFGL